MKPLNKYIKESSDMKLDEASLLDDEDDLIQNIDTAVENAAVWDYIKTKCDKKGKHQPHCDSMGREMKPGDIVLYPHFHKLVPGIIVGFNDFADGLRCEIVQNKSDIPQNSYSHKYYTMCKECIKISSLKLLKNILE